MRTHKATTTTCAEPGCKDEREWSDQRGAYRSRYCASHRRARDKEPRKPIPAPPRAYSPFEVLTAWREDRWLGDLCLNGVRVYGIQQHDGGYRVQLSGASVGVVLDGDERLLARGQTARAEGVGRG